MYVICATGWPSSISFTWSHSSDTPYALYSIYRTPGSYRNTEAHFGKKKKKLNTTNSPCHMLAEVWEPEEFIIKLLLQYFNEHISFEKVFLRTWLSLSPVCPSTPVTRMKLSLLPPRGQREKTSLRRKYGLSFLSLAAKRWVTSFLVCTASATLRKR